MEAKSFIKKYLIIEFIIFALLLIIDLVSKQLIQTYMELGESITVIPYLFNFYYTHNTGAAFGILEDQQWFFIVITSIALVGFSYALYRFRNQGRLLTCSLAMIISGALGNFVDRLAFGYVRDFIQFDFWDSFAIFNIADSALVIGCILFAVYVIFFYKEKPKQTDAKNDKKEVTDEQAD